MNAHTAPPRRDLYPAIEPYQSEMLRVSPLHTVYFEQCGAPRGRAALALHGGPGGGLSPEMRRFFDPARYRVRADGSARLRPLDAARRAPRKHHVGIDRRH
ncbi:MAG: hypothetical protein WDM79_07800 [Terricaulis sp.]